MGLRPSGFFTRTQRAWRNSTAHTAKQSTQRTLNKHTHTHTHTRVLSESTPRPHTTRPNNTSLRTAIFCSHCSLAPARSWQLHLGMTSHMAAAAAHLAARPITSNEDQTRHARLGKRMVAVLGLSHQKGSKIRIAPKQVMISTLNRQFSCQQVHRTILPSFIKDGHDPTRPKFGVCCEVRDPVRLQQLIAYNQGMAEKSPLMPPVTEHMALYEALSSNHYNVALRLVGTGHGSPAGDLARLRQEDATLADAAEFETMKKIAAELIFLYFFLIA